MGHGVKVSDLKKEDALKGEPTRTSTAPTTHANTTTTNTNTTEGSTKVLGCGSSAFQPIHKPKESLPKENGEDKRMLRIIIEVGKMMKNWNVKEMSANEGNGAKENKVEYWSME